MSFKVDKIGMHTLKSTSEAITDVSTLHNVLTLSSVIRLINQKSQLENRSEYPSVVVYVKATQMP